jgi:ubiquinone/menaquinone biosynthesis C-methylase UbiE
MGFKETLAHNFRQPKGIFGKLIGVFMNKGNDFMNRFAINLLQPQREDHILEIGFGNGKYITEIAQVTQDGFVAGIDFSETMVNQARRRNKDLISQGIVDIKLGEVNKISFDNSTFDKVFTVNTIYFWPNPKDDLKEIYRVLKPNGRLIVSFRSKEKMEKFDFTKNGFRLFEPKEVVQLLLDAGFKDVKLESTQDKFLDVNCVIAIK